MGKRTQAKKQKEEVALASSEASTAESQADRQTKSQVSSPDETTPVVEADTATNNPEADTTASPPEDASIEHSEKQRVEEATESSIYIPTKEEARILTLSPQQMGYAARLQTVEHLPAPLPPKQCRGESLGPQTRTLVDKKGIGFTYQVGWTIPNEMRHKFQGNAQQYVIEFIDGRAKVPEDVAIWFQEQSEHDPGRYTIS